ncbi:OLC1v1011560C1 [Oldenlandia corymbosa var. corymbosa]|uniref:OLC1v1011560C1 n=1 Tax=Oldenlandia corymbosa var. corymbosa TaxID=529605 RepID=A0AAV1DVL2_OLDCO|nr:OLC1v1011560C1 [Oldenlandia corymbosa var. corymbosa]
MLPTTSNSTTTSSSEHHHAFKKPIKPHNQDHHHLLTKNIFSLFQTHIVSDTRFWLLTAFIFLQALILFITRSSPPSLSPPHNGGPVRADHGHLFSHFANSTTNWHSKYDDPECGSGRVYVYDLPSMFTKDLVLYECDDLQQWRWQCGIGTNDGYGKEASELAGIVPDHFLPAWYRTNQFSLELIFHQRILNYKCRTLDPESATAYYIPFYAGLAVAKYLWIDDIPKRDYHCNKLLEWVQNKTYWKKRNGSDHFIVIGRIAWDFRRWTEPGKKWGSSFLNQPAMEKVTRFTLEKPDGIYEDLSIPYPTGFHPQSRSQLQQWQDFVRRQNRTSLFSYVGASHGGSLDNDFRSMLLNYCYNETGCHVVDCAQTACNNGSAVLLKAYLSSHFCLQPKGDSYTRRGVFDCMVAGSIPVFFWNRTAYDQYQWFLPQKFKSYSVFIDHEDVLKGLSIRKVLEGYSKKKLMKMREKVIETIPNIVFSRPSNKSEIIGDAFDIAVEGVLGRFKYEKMWDEEWKDDEDDILTR